MARDLQLAALMPAVRMTWVHLVLSALNLAAHSFGVLPTSSNPSAAIR